MWITKEEYGMEGASCIHKKALLWGVCWMEGGNGVEQTMRESKSDNLEGRQADKQPITIQTNKQTNNE